MAPKDSVPQTAMERVWERLKERASLYAASGSPISMDDTLSVVIAICNREHLERAPAEAIEYLARELVRLTDEAIAKRLNNR